MPKHQIWPIRLRGSLRLLLASLPSWISQLQGNERYCLKTQAHRYWGTIAKVVLWPLQACAYKCTYIHTEARRRYRAFHSIPLCLIPYDMALLWTWSSAGDHVSPSDHPVSPSDRWTQPLPAVLRVCWEVRCRLSSLCNKYSYPRNHLSSPLSFIFMKECSLWRQILKTLVDCSVFKVYFLKCPNIGKTWKSAWTVSRLNIVS